MKDLPNKEGNNDFRIPSSIDEPRVIQAGRNERNKWICPFDHIEIFHIIVYHFQDTSLFQIRLSDMPDSAIHLGRNEDKIVSLIKLDTLSFADEFACFPTGWTQIDKLLAKAFIIPFMIVILVMLPLFLFLIFLCPCPCLIFLPWYPRYWQHQKYWKQLLIRNFTRDSALKGMMNEKKLKF